MSTPRIRLARELRKRFGGGSAIDQELNQPGGIRVPLRVMVESPETIQAVRGYGCHHDTEHTRGQGVLPTKQMGTLVLLSLQVVLVSKYSRGVKVAEGVGLQVVVEMQLPQCPHERPTCHLIHKPTLLTDYVASLYHNHHVPRFQGLSRPQNEVEKRIRRVRQQVHLRRTFVCALKYGLRIHHLYQSDR